MNERDYGAVRVGSTDEYQRQLTPTVTDIAWRPTGSKTASISVKGNNFFTDTQVLLGDTRYSESAGNMAIKSDQSFELTSTLDQVAGGLGVIEGRYGLSTPLIKLGPTCQGPCVFGAVIDTSNGPELGASLGGTRRLSMTLQAILDPQASPQTDAIDLQNLPLVTNRSLTAADSKIPSNALQTPILSVNGTAIPLPYDIVSIQPLENDQKVQRIQISADVSDKLLTDISAATIKIAWPFYDPAKWSTSTSYSPPDAQFQIARISDNTIILSRVNLASFVPSNQKEKYCWTLIASDKPLSFGTPDCSASPAPPPPDKSKTKTDKKKTKDDKKTEPAPSVTAIAKTGQPIYTFMLTLSTKFPAKAILVDTNRVIYHLVIPDLTEKKDTTPKVTTLKQWDAAWIDITYPADKVPYRVETNGVSLKWRIDPQDPKAKPDATAVAKTTDKTMHVEITRAETSKPSSLEVVVFDKTQAQIAKQQVTITPAFCCDGGKK